MSGPMILIAVGLVVLIFFLGYRVGYESRRMEMWDVNEAAAKAEEAQECVAEAARKAVREMAYLYERHEGETDEELRRRGLTDALAWRHLRAAVARPRPALPLDLDALERAFIVYWKDFGTPRHNLTAAIREYLAALPAPEPRMGYVLAMAVLQSDAWASADDELRAAVEHFTTGAALPAEPPDTASPMIGSRRGRTDEAGSIPAEASGLPAEHAPADPHCGIQSSETSK